MAIGQDKKTPRLSGWVRLWIVLSVVLGVIAFSSTYMAERKIVTLMFEYRASDVGVNVTEDQILSEARRKHARLDDCSTPPYVSFFDSDSDRLQVECERDTLGRIIRSIPYAMLPGAFLLIIGLIAAWVRKGFQRND